MNNNSKRDTIFFIAVVIIFLLLYSKTISWLGSRWYNDEDYSHGPLIPLVSGYLIWIKRDKLKQIELSTNMAGLYLLVVSLLIHIFSIRAEVSFTSAYSLILSIAGIVLYFFGRNLFNEVIFPICYLVFMVPFFQFIIDPLSNKLKLFSAYLSAEIIDFAGIPVYRDGVMLHLATGSLEVANPCSGIRSIISLLALGTIFSYFSTTTMTNRIMLVCSTIPLAVVGNLARIVFSGVMTNAGIDVTTGFIHTLTGLIVFAVAFAGLIGVRKLLIWKSEIKNI